VHQALLFRQWTADLTLFLHTEPRPTDEETEQLAARGIRVVEGEVASLEIVDDHLAGVRLSSGEVVSLRALAVTPRLVARAGMGLTAVPGVWVAGNAADLMAQVVGAADAGVRAAAAINADLIAEDTRHAVAAHRDRLLTSAAGAQS